ncbi:MAG TPA: hypothetical protein DF383_08300, partial [Deltaproteobacteria bacterium]|nr:hypothetical protein [Deltaproteobacteria bacterium]
MKKSLLTFLTFAFFLSVLMPVSARAEEEKSEKASGKDAHLLKDLQSGQGSLAIRFSYYELNKGIDLDGLKQQGRSWEQAL